MARIKASNVRPGTTGAGGWDVDVEVGGVRGECTLLTDDHDGRPARWGSLDHWLCSDLCRLVRDTSEDMRDDLLAAIQETAVEAIEASGVEPADADADETCERCGAIEPEPEDDEDDDDRYTELV